MPRSNWKHYIKKMPPKPNGPTNIYDWLGGMVKGANVPGLVKANTDLAKSLSKEPDEPTWLKYMPESTRRHYHQKGKPG